MTSLSINILLIGIILITCIDTKADYSDISDQTFNYVLDSSAWSVQVNDLIEGGTGGTFGNLNLPQRGQFSVEVLDVDANWGVDFRVSNATDNVLGHITNDEFLMEFAKFLYYPEEECSRITTEGFNSKDIVNGPEILDWFFIETEADVWDFMDNLTTVEYHNVLPGVYAYEAYLQAHFEHQNKQVMFDVYMRGSFENQTLDVNIQFDHSIKFVWNDTTGILLGYRISTNFNGLFASYSIAEEINVVIHLSGYDLPSFKFISAFIPGFEIGIAVFTIGLIIVFNVIIRCIRKKRRKEEN